MDHGHCGMIQAKAHGEEVVRRLQRQLKAITGDGIDAFSRSDIVEEEDAAIQSRVNPVVRR